MLAILKNVDFILRTVGPAGKFKQDFSMTRIALEKVYSQCHMEDGFEVGKTRGRENN